MPLLLERSAHLQPRLCGEFLSAEAADALAALGVDVARLGGQPTHKLRLACGSLLIEAELPFTAFGLSRNVLDGALRARAQAVGATLWRGVRAGVQQLSTADRPHRLRVTTTRGMAVEIQAETLLLACGKTDIAARQRRPRRGPEPLIGLQPMGARLPSLLQALRRECPLFEQRLQGASWDDAPPRSIFRVPYGYLHRASVKDPPGVWRLGDQAAVIPSFTGDGVAIALHSAAIAAEELLAGSSAHHYHQRLRRDLHAQMIRAQMVYGVGRHRPLRGALLSLLRRWPALTGWLAQITRVDAAASRL